MHLKKITLKNFRCFKSIEMELHPRLTVIVADNGGGKTSVLDGIAIGLAPIYRVLSSANQRLEGPWFKDNDFRIISTGRSKTEIKSDYAQTILEAVDGRKWDHWRPSTKGPQPEIKVGQSDLNILTDILSSYKEHDPKTLPVFAYYGALRGWIEIPERLRMSAKSELNYDYPTSSLFGSLDAVSDFKELLKWFDSEESSVLRAQKESEDHIRSVPLEAVRDAIATILGDKYYDPHFDGKHKFVVRSTAEPKKLQVSQLSQGYQSMLALVMDFARRLALANPHLADNSEATKDAVDYYERWGGSKVDDADYLSWLTKGPILAPAVMLIDEVDLHLHPSWQQRVLEDLMRAFPHTQFIVTTHSPQVVSTVRKENLRILEPQDDGLWTGRIPEKNPYAHANSVALETVMGGQAYPPSPTLDMLREYQRLVGNNEHDLPRALELRSALEQEWGESDPELRLMDVTIRKNETLRKLRGQNA